MLLAAGSSRRFGRQNKLLAALRGKPLVRHALERADANGVSRVLVVVPSLGGVVARTMRAAAVRRCRLVVARTHRQGMGASFAAGLRAVRPIERELLLFLGDMPFVSSGARLRLAPGLDAVRPVWNGVPGHPVLVRTAAARAAMRQAKGDAGLLGRLDRHRIGLVQSCAGTVADVDTRKALARARRAGKRVG